MESGSGSSQFSVNAAMPAQQTSPPESSESGTTGLASYSVISETTARRAREFASGSPSDPRSQARGSPDRHRRAVRTPSMRSPRASAMLKDKERARSSRGEDRVAVRKEDIGRSQLIECLHTIQALRQEVQAAHRESFEIYESAVSEFHEYHKALEEMASIDMGSEQRIAMLERQRDHMGQLAKHLNDNIVKIQSSHQEHIGTIKSEAEEFAECEMRRMMDYANDKYEEVIHAGRAEIGRIQQQESRMMMENTFMESNLKAAANQERLEWMVERGKLMSQQQQTEARAQLLKEETTAAHEELSFWKERSANQDNASMKLREELSQRNQALQSAGSRDDASRNLVAEKVRGLEMEMSTKDEIVRIMRQELAEERSKLSTTQTPPGLTGLRPPAFAYNDPNQGAYQSNIPHFGESEAQSEEHRRLRQKASELQILVDGLEEDVVRLRNDRNEWRSWFDQMEEDEEHESERRREAEDKYNNLEINFAGGGSGGTITKISRKEADKVSVPSWPSIGDLDIWKARVVQAVVAASGDQEQAPWMTWLSEATVDEPDLVSLQDSGDIRFHSIDTKLAIALQAVVENAGESGRDVAIKLRQRMQLCGKSTSYVKGREIFAMIIMSFRSTSHVQVMYNAQHLWSLTYPGDKQLSTFLSKWEEMLMNMRPTDIPHEITLRDCLFLKIRDSQFMSFDLKQYNSYRDNDPGKTYEYLMDMMRKYVERQKEDKNLAARERSVKEMLTGGVKATPATTSKDKKDTTKVTAAPAEAGKKKKDGKDSESSQAASVLPTPNPKSHPENKKKGKGRGKGSRSRDPSRAPSADDKKKIPCVYHFNKGGCNKGKDCPYSHNKSSQNSSKGKGSSSRASTPKGTKGPCYAWIRGNCPKGDRCSFIHDPKAKPKTSAASETVNTDKTKKAAPALTVIDDDWNPSCSSVKKIESNGLRVSFNIPRNQRSKGKEKSHLAEGFVLKQVVEAELTSNEHRELVRMSECRARARAVILDNIAYPSIHQVQVVVGPKFDIMIKENDEGDFAETLVDHGGDRPSPDEGTMCIAIPARRSDYSFIMDTGCGFDLISRSRVKRLGLECKNINNPVTFYTANGITETGTKAQCKDEVFSGTCDPYVLEETPSVISVGNKCETEGYAFIWPPHGKPFMINPEVLKIQLETKAKIPYVDIGEDGSRPVKSTMAEKIIEVLRQGEDDETSATQGQVNEPMKLVIDSESGDECVVKIFDEKIKQKKRRGKKSKVKVKAAASEDGVEVDEGVPEERAVEVEEEDMGDGEDDGHEDSEDIEVDVVEGEGRLAKKGTIEGRGKDRSTPSHPQIQESVL